MLVADESGSGGSCSSSCGVVSPTVTSPNESSRDSSPDMVVLSHVSSPPGFPKCPPPHPTNVGASPAGVAGHTSPPGEDVSPANVSAHYGTADSARRSRDLSTLLSEFQDWRAPGCEKELQQAMQKLSISDYEAKQILANKAMREPVGGTVRVPTSNWSGYGFSKSSPSYHMRQQFQEAGLLKKIVDRTCATSRDSPISDSATRSSTKPGEDSVHAGWTTDTSSLEAEARYLPPSSRPYELLMPASDTQPPPQAADPARDVRAQTIPSGTPGDEEEWGSGAKWSSNDGSSSSSSAVTASAVDSGIAASISSSNQASLSLSDPESSDGLGHSAASSASYGSSSALKGIGRGSVRGALKHDERLSASTFHELISEERRQCAALPLRSAELDLPALLESMALSQYIDIFNSQGVDLRTFLTLNDSELKELGIGAFGHRKRLLIAIKNLTSFLPELGSARNGGGHTEVQREQQRLTEDRPYDPSSKTVTWNC
ncbi:Sterile alpha motif domain [Trinorchestia longiramus]|nr:Sterile alpha motif domain [Trinorchestia longiramus]